MNTLKHPYLTASVVMASLSLFACADQAKPPRASPSLTSGEAPWAAMRRAVKSYDDGRSGSIVVDKEIAALCALPTTHFAFDRSNILGDASQALDALVTCLSTGALKGRALTLVGHADPRGDVQYNFALGQRRAGTVEKYLSEHGIQAALMTTTSRGELDATGVDTASWAKDRKVEILLASADDES